MQTRLKILTELNPEILGWQRRFEDVLGSVYHPGRSSPERLHEAMRYAMLGGGKRFRPLLVYAAGQALGVDMERLDPIACAIETIHGYSLIHDDLPAMDDDDLRRGNPTCHRAYDEATAILAGDALQAFAFEVLAENLQCDPSAALKIVCEIARACGSEGMAGGQVLDLASIGRHVKLDELCQIHSLKTGALIQVCVTTPAILAGVSQDVQTAMAKYGESVGMAFQIYDDILDVAGFEAQTGKNTQSDAARDKPNFPSILGLEESHLQAAQWCRKALDALGEIERDTGNLEDLATYVISRNH
jgi:farnesyl diphosphate synthase